MPEDFDKKQAGKKIKNIKNEVINPYRDAMKKDSKVDFTSKQTLENKAEKGYKEAIDIEKKAKEAKVELDKDAMRRLNKIKTRYEQATGKTNLEKYQTGQAYQDNRQAHQALVSGQKHNDRKQRGRG